MLGNIPEMSGFFPRSVFQLQFLIHEVLYGCEMALMSSAGELFLLKKSN